MTYKFHLTFHDCMTCHNISLSNMPSMCFNDLLLPSMSFFECLDGVFYDIPLSSMCIRKGLQKKYKTSDFAEQGRGALRITPVV